MQHTLKLDQNKNFTLRAEKVQGEWWLELIERATGLTYIIYCDTKQHAIEFFKGMNLAECYDWMIRAEVKPLKMYKEGKI